MTRLHADLYPWLPGRGLLRLSGTDCAMNSRNRKSPTASSNPRFT